MEIRIANPQDFQRYFEHIVRFEQEALTDEIISGPYDTVIERNFDETRVKRSHAWALSLQEAGWRRAFLLIEKSANLIVGELQLFQDPPLKSSSHRACISMGIERSYRNMGSGSKLLATCIEWATDQPQLEWLDLFVFDHNLPAIKLYKKFGFFEVGRTVDRLRVRGEKITDIAMALKLRG